MDRLPSEVLHLILLFLPEGQLDVASMQEDFYCEPPLGYGSRVRTGPLPNISQFSAIGPGISIERRLALAILFAAAAGMSTDDLSRRLSDVNDRQTIHSFSIQLQWVLDRLDRLDRSGWKPSSPQLKGGLAELARALENLDGFSLSTIKRLSKSGELLSRDGRFGCKNAPLYR